MNPNHGGKRPGAGRPNEHPPDCKRRFYYLTDPEHRAIKRWIKERRKAGNPPPTT